MTNELELIAQVTSTGDLRSKLVQADEAKVDVEAILTKRVRKHQGHFFLFKINNLFIYFFFRSRLEYIITRNVRGMGTM